MSVKGHDKSSEPATKQVHPVRVQNGRTVCSTAKVKMASSSQTTASERADILVAGAPNLPLNDSTSNPLKFWDKRTKPIVKLVFLKLCLECSNEFRTVERDIIRLEKTADRELVYLVAERIVGVLKEWNVVRTNLDDFRKQRWNVYDGNMYTEFSKVTYEMFSETVNWGRVLVFLGFSVSFTTYLLEQDIPTAANSIMEWTCQVVEEDLAKFFISNGGWEAFADYLDTSLRSAIRRRHRIPREIQAQQVLPGTQHMAMSNGDGGSESSMWPSALVAGALAVGAVGLFTLRQALS